MPGTRGWRKSCDSPVHASCAIDLLIACERAAVVATKVFGMRLHHNSAAEMYDCMVRPFEPNEANAGSEAGGSSPGVDSTRRPVHAI